MPAPGMRPAREVPLPLPMRGFHSASPYAEQPKGTTPEALNVRGVSADEERLRVGSRPCVVPAYSTPIGGTAAAVSSPVQWLGWLDYGFGDLVVYDDQFEYANASLQDVKTDDDAGNPYVWPDADIDLKVLNGYVHLSGGGGLPYSETSSGEYNLFNADDWQDFTLEVGIQWNVGTTATLKLWVSSTTEAATNGMLLTFTLTSSWVSFPGLGFQSSIAMTLAAEGNGTTTTKRWTSGAAWLVQKTGGVIRVEATADTVKVFFGEAQVLTVPRPAGASASTPCSKGGFTLAESLPSGSPTGYDSLIDFRVMNWTLTAQTRATDTARKLVGIGNRRVYAESSEGTIAGSAVDTDQLADVPLYSAAHCNGRLFILDGTTPRYYDPMAGTNSVKDWTPRKGALEKGCSIIANWRNRLLLAGTTQDPQNIYASRQDDPWDFDYGMDDAQSAFALNAYNLGRIGDAITALCPTSDNTLIVGCTGSVWQLRGDPAAGGIVVKLTDDCGMLSNTAWCSDNEGNIYFLSTQGFFHQLPLRKPKDLSSYRIPGMTTISAVQPGKAAASGDYYVAMCYDQAQVGVHIWLTPYASDTAIHYFFDLRNNAFWPETYQNIQGPTAAAYYNAYTPAYRRVLMGGRDGWLYGFDETKAYDNIGGTTGGTSGFTAKVLFGPYQLIGDVRDCVMTGFKPVLSNTGDTVHGAVIGAHTAENCVKATGNGCSVNLSPGENPQRPRVKGCSHAIRVYSLPADKAIWAMESMVAEIVEAGRCRG